MKLTIKSSILTVLAMLMLMVFGMESATAQRDHHGYHRYHVWRNEHWVWENHPANWVVPVANVGPAQVDIDLGWSNHPGWQRYHVYRNNHWGYVYHPKGWSVPGAWRGPHHDHR